MTIRNLLPKFYQEFLETKFKPSQYLILLIIIGLLQKSKIATLEELANKFPQTILFESRRKKLQRFLSLPNLTFVSIWFPILSVWLALNFPESKELYLAIDRTQWTGVNLLVVSLIYQKRAIPVYCEMLPKQGSSNLAEQQRVLSLVFPLFKKYKIILLGDREFCSVGLAQWLREQTNTYFCLRLRKNEYIEIEPNIWIQLKEIGRHPGFQFYLQGIKVTKTKGFTQGEIAGKWKRKYRGKTVEESWFILTNLGSFDLALKNYQKRFGIEEMFRDFKSGGYQVNQTYLHGERLMALLLLITLAYSSAFITGEKIKTKRQVKYLGRVKEKRRHLRRHSDFYIALHGKDWVESLDFFQEATSALIALSPHKRVNYQRGRRAATLIQSTF